MNAKQITPGVLYFPDFVADPNAALVEVMEQARFVQRSRTMYGRTFATPRMEAWYGPQAYRFGGSALPSAPMLPVLTALGIRAESVADDAHFSSCLVNLYRDGSDSVSWHADDEPEMGDPVIASISLGAPRDFLLRRKAPTPALASAMLPNKISVTLEHGSMLVMLRGVQDVWEHCLPKRRRCTERRINLTFRDCS